MIRAGLCLKAWKNCKVGNGTESPGDTRRNINTDRHIYGMMERRIKYVRKVHGGMEGEEVL